MTYVIKPIMKMANHKKWLLFGIVASWLVASALFGVIEGTGLIDSLYWSMTTMSTVGYGDLSPATALGKVVTIAFQAWSIFVLVPCAVTNIIDSIRVDEAKFTHAEQEWQQDAIISIAKGINVVLPKPPSDF